MHKNLPKWVFRFLEFTCSTRFLDELTGDLLELFDREVQSIGLPKARQKFIRRVLLSIRWYRLPKIEEITPFIMYKNYYKVAIRHALKNQSASTVHTLGLMFGLAAVFYIGLFIKHELHFDTTHEKGAQLYRVLRQDAETGKRAQETSSLHGASIAEAYPFTNVCRFGNDPVKIGDKNPYLIDEFYWSDSTFFELFSFNFLEGNPSTCLNQVNSLVLTQSLSKQLFGNQSAIGQSVKVKVYDGDQEFPMKVTAVVEDPSPYTHIQFEALGSMANAETIYSNLVKQWGFSWLRTYIEVPDNRIREIEDGMPDLISKLFGEAPPPGFGMAFQSFKDIYLHSDDIPKSTIKGNIRHLKIFGSVGILILIVSLLNYINLSTARGVTRAKEVGIRKVLGSQNGAIFSQFMVESLLFTFASGIAAAILIKVLLPFLNTLSQLNLSLEILSWLDGLILLLGLFMLGLLAGLLPALVMSKLPTLTRKGNTTIQFKVREWPLTRKIFVGIQYFVALALLVGAIVVYQQYNHLKNFDLGFNSDQLLHIPVDDRTLQNKMHLLKEELTKVTGVLGATATGEDLPSKLNNTWNLDWNGANKEAPQGIDVVGVDRDYFEVLGIDFKTGQNFVHDFQVDSARSVIFNEQAEALIGKTDLVHQQISIGGRDRRVLGIVNNHHNTSLHDEIVPLAYFIFPPGFRVSPDNLLVKIDTRDIPALLTQLEEIWERFSPDPFEFNFVDEAFAEAYHAERRFSTLIGAFTAISIVISMIGLFGLINFIIALKLKEIGIRRILGANFFSLLQLLSRDFLQVFVIASFLALPAAYHLLNSWLENYEYRIQISAFVLLLAVIICLGLSILVIWYHLRKNTHLAPSEIISRE